MRTFREGGAISSAPKAHKERSGYVLVGTRENQSQYSIVIASGQQISHVMQLGDLELNAIHEWSVLSDGQELTFEIRLDGKVVNSARIPGDENSVFGFCATLRFLDTKSLLIVAEN
jgi:hypothetical protein